MNSIVLTLALLALVLLPSFGCAATGGHTSDIKPGSLLHRSVTIDGVESKYAVWVPPSYNPHEPSPCIVFLHGRGECGTDGEKQTTVGLFPAVQAAPEKWSAVIVMPQKPRPDAEWEEYETIVLAALGKTNRELKIDTRRTTLTGLSQGGHGTWVIGARHPNLFCALAPVCGYCFPNAIAPRIAGRPVWAFHGGKDDVVPLQESEHMVDAIRQAGKLPEPKLTIYPEANHNSWDKAYHESGLSEWLLSQKSP